METNLEDVYIFQLEKALRQIKKYKSKKLKQVGLEITSEQWVLVKRISEVPGINQRALADSTFKDPASITRTLDLLENKGYIERHEVENNRREYSLFLTQMGEDLVHRILPVAIDIRAKGIKGLTEEDMQDLRRILSKIADNFD